MEKPVSQEEVRRIRRDLGLTQAELARKLNVDPVTVARWETGKRQCSGIYAELVRGYDKCGWTTVSETTKGIGHWSSRDYVPEVLGEQLKRADILIVPQEGIRDRVLPVFPEGTDEFFQYLKENVPAKVKVDIAIDDSNYHSLALHSDLLILGEFIAKNVYIPLAVSLVAAYIWHRLGSKSKTSDVQVVTTLSEKKNDEERCIRVAYKGPADKFESTLRDTLATIYGDSAEPSIAENKSLYRGPNEK